MPRFIVPSVSTPETAYDVDTDKPNCTCLAFKHSRGKRWCKHLTMAEARPDTYACIEDASNGQKTIYTPTMDAGPGLFTIGHSNHTIENFLSLLRQHHIRVVIDVRSSPYSRFSPHFCRDVLRHAVRGAGIDYYWAGSELGGRDKIPTTSAAFVGRMNQIVEMSHRSRVALMCSEGKPQDCHRAMKLTAWIHRDVQDATARHILPDGSLLSSEILEEKMGDAWLWSDFGGEKGL